MLQEQDFEVAKVTVGAFTLICTWRSRTSFRNNLEGGAGGAEEGKTSTMPVGAWVPAVKEV